MQVIVLCSPPRAYAIIRRESFGVLVSGDIAGRLLLPALVVGTVAT